MLVDPVSPLIAVDLSNGSALTVTASHPVYVDKGQGLPGAGWLEAGQLRVGDYVRTASGVDVIVAGLRSTRERALVYTLTVAKDHTFFVGSARLLVHNVDPPCEKISVAILSYVRRYGHLTGRQINDIIDPEQRALLQEFFGQSLNGAEDRLRNFHLPAGLTNDTLLKYAVVARKQVLAPPSSVAFNVQAARLTLVIRALLQRGL